VIDKSNNALKTEFTKSTIYDYIKFSK
jgi:hypothetical protein